MTKLEKVSDKQIVATVSVATDLSVIDSQIKYKLCKTGWAIRNTYLNFKWQTRLSLFRGCSINPKGVKLPSTTSQRYTHSIS
jgi:hypothetical protein